MDTIILEWYANSRTTRAPPSVLRYTRHIIEIDPYTKLCSTEASQATLCTVSLVIFISFASLRETCLRIKP
jgi:hypothetical protein